MPCVICEQRLVAEGSHTPTQLSCGHLFGYSCLVESVNLYHRCPICNLAARSEDARPLVGDLASHIPGEASNADSTQSFQLESVLARENQGQSLNTSMSSTARSIANEQPFEVNVMKINSGGGSFKLRLSDGQPTFVTLLKERIHQYCGIPVDRQTLLYGGRQLEDGKRLGDYNIANGATIHLVRRLIGGMSSALTRIQKEVIEMSRNPPSNCTAGPVGSDLYSWQAVIVGPPSTPYEDGLFKLSIQLPLDYPMKPPKVQFITQIYHPNVHTDGRICVDVLTTEWSPVMTISKVLLSICALLCVPNPNSALNSSAGKLMKENRAEFEQTAREWTAKHAQ